MAFTYTMVSEFLTKEECDTILKFSLKELELETSGIFTSDDEEMARRTRSKTHQGS